jgi:hypothetical protein
MQMNSYRFRFRKSVCVPRAGVVMERSVASRTIQATSELEALKKLQYALEREAGGHAVQIFLV